MAGDEENMRVSLKTGNPLEMSENISSQEGDRERCVVGTLFATSGGGGP